MRMTRIVNQESGIVNGEKCQGTVNCPSLESGDHRFGRLRPVAAFVECIRNRKRRQAAAGKAVTGHRTPKREARL